MEKSSSKQHYHSSDDDYETSSSEHEIEAHLEDHKHAPAHKTHKHDHSHKKHNSDDEEDMPVGVKSSLVPTGPLAVRTRAQAAAGMCACAYLRVSVCAVYVQHVCIDASCIVSTAQQKGGTVA